MTVLLEPREDTTQDIKFFCTTPFCEYQDKVITFKIERANS